MKKIEEIILHKMQQETFPHLVTFNSGSKAHARDDLIERIYKLTYAYLFNKKEYSEEELINHPDLLIIGEKEGSLKEYKDDDLKEIFKHFVTRPLMSSKKVVIIHDTDLIKESSANKLLKVLEEPEIPSYIFLLNPQGKKLLQTIESRSIKIKLDAKEEEEEQDKKEEEIMSTSIFSYLEKYKNEIEDENLFFKTSVKNLSKIIENQDSINELNTFMKSLQKSLKLQLPLTQRLALQNLITKKIIKNKK